MRLSIVVELDAAPPAAIERGAGASALMLADAHRAPAFPLAPFLAHLAVTWFPYSQNWSPPNEAPPGAYLPPVTRPRPLLINRAV